MKNFVKFLIAFALIVAAGTFFVTRGIDSLPGQSGFLEHFMSNQRSLIEASGTVVEERRVVGDFTRIELNGSGSVTLVAGLETAVSVKTDKNLLPFVETEVADGVLRISIKPGVRFSIAPVSYTVSAKRIESIKSNGSGNVVMDAPLSGDTLKLFSEGSGKIRAVVKAKKLEVQIAGSGDVVVTGAAEDLSLIILGSGNVKAAGLSGRKTDANVAGSGNVELGIFDSIEANIAGSGDIVYSGSPRVSSRVLGSGKLRSR
ncbi:MAG: head GIN domain-containing protein [Treponemataceae bacterium]